MVLKVEKGNVTKNGTTIATEYLCNSVIIGLQQVYFTVYEGKRTPCMEWVWDEAGVIQVTSLRPKIGVNLRKPYIKQDLSNFMPDLAAGYRGKIITPSEIRDALQAFIDKQNSKLSRKQDTLRTVTNIRPKGLKMTTLFASVYNLMELLRIPEYVEKSLNKQDMFVKELLRKFTVKYIAATSYEDFIIDILDNFELLCECQFFTYTSSEKSTIDEMLWTMDDGYIKVYKAFAANEEMKDMYAIFRRQLNKRLARHKKLMQMA